MAITENITTIIRITCSAGGAVQDIQRQTITELARDGEIIAREASVMEAIDAAGLASVLAPEDRLALRAALA